MKDGKLLVLLLEDRDVYAKWAMRDFDEQVEVARARNCADAFELFELYGNAIEAMYVDALIQGEGTIEDDYTYDFVKFVRAQGYRGHMVTASSEEAMNVQLMHAGCDIQSTKDDAPRDLLRVLGL